MAAPVFGAAGTYDTGTSAAPAIGVPSGVTSGQIILVALYKEIVATVTTLPTGFAEATASPISTTASGVHSLHLFWKRATGADSGTYTFGWTGSTYWEASATRFTGCIASGNPFDTGAGAPTSAQRSSNGTVTPGVSLTTQGADRLLVHTGGNWQTGTWTAATGFTKRIDNASDLLLETETFTSAGASGTVTASCSGSSSETAWLGALLPVAAATSPTTSAFFSFLQG